MDTFTLTSGSCCCCLAVREKWVSGPKCPKGSVASPPWFQHPLVIQKHTSFMQSDFVLLIFPQFSGFYGCLLNFCVCVTHINCTPYVIESLSTTLWLVFKVFFKQTSCCPTMSEIKVFLPVLNAHTWKVCHHSVLQAASHCLPHLSPTTLCVL